MMKKGRKRTLRRKVQSGLGGKEIREPIVDVFEEEDLLLVQAELPGISKRDVQIKFKDDVLTISAQRGERSYRREVLLPRDISLDKIQVSCKNGILEIKCPK
jgi:HSP20 family protein